MKCFLLELLAFFVSRPPHRGAWIEIVFVKYRELLASVAPRTGGRGLKCKILYEHFVNIASPPAQGGVD